MSNSHNTQAIVAWAEHRRARAQATLDATLLEIETLRALDATLLEIETLRAENARIEAEIAKRRNRVSELHVKVASLKAQAEEAAR